MFSIHVFGVLDGSDGAFKFGVKIGALPGFGTDGLKNFQMTLIEITGSGDFLDGLLAVVEFALKTDE